jgi:hypothetical protein
MTVAAAQANHDLGVMTISNASDGVGFGVQRTTAHRDDAAVMCRGGDRAPRIAAFVLIASQAIVDRTATVSEEATIMSNAGEHAHISGSDIAI